MDVFLIIGAVFNVIFMSLLEELIKVFVSIVNVNESGWFDCLVVRLES